MKNNLQSKIHVIIKNKNSKLLLLYKNIFVLEKKYIKTIS